MGVRVTDIDNVAIYDSVTGFAFGPTFNCEDAAGDFLSWLDSNDEKDPRLMTNSELESKFGEWVSVHGEIWGYE